MLSNNSVQNKWVAGYLRVIKLCLVLFIILQVLSMSTKAAEAVKPTDDKVSSEQLAALENQIVVMQEIVAANKKNAKKTDDKNKFISNELERLQSVDRDGSTDNLKSTTLVDGPSLSQVSVSKYNTVSVHAQNVKISTVLQELSVKSRKNIILAAGSDRVVSMTFYTVPFYKALKTMLDVNGLAYVENNNFIEVFTKEKMSKRIQGKNGMETKVFRLNYLRPKDALIAAEELLSSDGRAKTIDDDKDIEEDSSNSQSENDRINSDPVYKPNKQRFALNSALIVFDYQENIKNISELLQKLDRRPKQILLEATILEVSLTDNNQFGINLSMLSSVKLTDYFSLDGGSAVTLKGSNVSGGFTTVNGLKGGVAVGDVSVLVNALDKITDVSVLSRPKVLSLDRQRARVLVGKNVGYLETSYSQDQIVQSVKFIEAGISLDVRPYIVDGGKVRLKLAPRISDVQFNNVTDAKNNSQQVPTESVQTVAADIVVPAGSTAVIGGLFQESTTVNRTQVPGYGNIPIIGQVGRSQTDAVIRRELIFLIKPIVLSDDKLDNLGERELCSSKEMLAGMRNGLLPWSKLRQCRQLNLRAYRSILTGERDIGFWLYRRSLQLRGDQSEVCKNLGDIAEKEYSTKKDDQLYKSINELIIKGETINNGTCASIVSDKTEKKSVEISGLARNEKKDSIKTNTDYELLSECEDISDKIIESNNSAGNPTDDTAEAVKKQSPFYMPNDDAIMEEDMFEDFDETFTGV